ncbi:MAG: hypothetical protein ACAI44_12380 [Candidatus Sericytochromatia bacterium]
MTELFEGNHFEGGLFESGPSKAHPADASLAEARVHKAQVNPDIDSISSLNLYEGTRVRHELIYGVVKDRKTGLFHHDYATFKTLRKTKATPWKADPKASFTLSEDKQQEVSKALDFLAAARGRPLEIAAGGLDHGRLIAALDGLDAEDRLEIILRLIRDLRTFEEPRQLMALIEQVDAEQLAAATRLFQIAGRRKALREFHRLLKTPDSEPGRFRDQFASHPWLLGSEACEPLSLEGIDSADDLLLQRTSDNWLELTLVRTPLPEPRLFHGEAPSGWFPIPELVMALSRVQLLLEKLDPETLLLEDEWTLQGRRARIVIGHLHGDPVQEMALQRLNRHLKQIEILSYDQVDRNAIKALARLQQAGRAQLPA